MIPGCFEYEYEYEYRFTEYEYETELKMWVMTRRAAHGACSVSCSLADRLAGAARIEWPGLD